MVDAHAHVLFRFDDGPHNLEESLALLRAAYQSGICEIVATSHYYSAHMALEDFIERRTRRLSELRDAISKENLGIRLYQGAEVYIDKVILNQKSLKELCYEGTNNILLEIPRSIQKLEDALQLIEQITSYYNVKPLIAHVERYTFLRKTSALKLLKSMGCMIQVDAEAFLKGFLDKHFACKALTEGLLDIVASDCHDLDKRSPNLAEAYDVIRKKFGQEATVRLMRNAEKLLTSDGE